MRNVIILFSLLLIVLCGCELWQAEKPLPVSPLPTPVSPVATPDTITCSDAPVPSDLAMGADTVTDGDRDHQEETSVTAAPMPDDSLFVAMQRLGLLGEPQYIVASGVGISFVCKHRQHILDDNTMDFQNCIIHVDDARRFYETFEVYLPVVKK